MNSQSLERMIVRLGLLLGLALLVAACGHFGKKESVAEASPAVSRSSAFTRSQVLSVQRTLKELGYDVGVADGVFGPKTTSAIRAYQKDQKLPADGKLTAALINRLAKPRATPVSDTLPNYQLGETYVYSDGSAAKIQKVGSAISFAVNPGGSRERPLNYLIVSEGDFRADAAPDFLQPLDLGKSSQYHLVRTVPDGSESESLVTCSIERATQTSVPAGSFETIQAICRETVVGKPRSEWQWFYAPSLHQVVREITKTEGRDAVTRDLVAVQPSTERWPTAARTGFDWAIVNALEAASNSPVEWSSTGVQARFNIRVDDAPSAYRAFVPGGAETSCKRFVLERTDLSVDKDYPGVACFYEGKWLIPSRQPYTFAVPPKGLSAATAAPDSKTKTETAR